MLIHAADMPFFTPVQVGELLSLDESDQALVRFPGGAEALKSLALENLCKVVPDSRPGLGDTV